MSTDSLTVTVVIISVYRGSRDYQQSIALQPLRTPPQAEWCSQILCHSPSIFDHCREHKTFVLPSQRGGEAARRFQHSSLSEEQCIKLHIYSISLKKKFKVTQSFPVKLLSLLMLRICIFYEGKINIKNVVAWQHTPFIVLKHFLILLSPLAVFDKCRRCLLNTVRQMLSESVRL